MGKVVKAVVGIVATVVGVVTGQWWLVAAGAALTMSSVMKVPKPTANAATEQRLSKRLEPESWRKIIFGQTAGGADLRYWEVFGAEANNYVEVIAVATHKVQGFGRFWINDDEVPFTGNAAVGQYAGHLSKQNVSVGVSGQGQPRGGHGKWTASSAMTGCAYYILDYLYKQEKFPQGISSRYTQEVLGAPVYDPRRDVRFGGTHVITDQSTWQYSPLDGNGKPIGRNNALQMLWYQLGWRINGKLVAGKGVDPADIDIDTFIQAANDCEAMGWYSDCILSTGDSHETNEGILEAAAQGNLLDTGGRFSYYVAIDDTANVAVDLTEDDIIGEGYDWTPRDPMSSFFNEVAGTFIDPNALYQPRPFPMVWDQAYYDADGRKERETVALSAVQDPEQAQRLMRLKLNRSRFQGEFNATFTYKAIRARNYSIVRLQIPSLGWTTPRLFRVISYGISAMGGIDLTLREEHPSIYTEGTVQELEPPSSGVVVDPFIQIPVLELTATPIVVQNEAGFATDGILLEYAPAPALVLHTEVIYFRTAVPAEQVSQVVAKENNKPVFPSLLPATEYTFRVRHFSIYNVPGPWAEITVTTGNATAIPIDQVVVPGNPEADTLAEVIANINAAIESINYNQTQLDIALEQANLTLTQAVQDIDQLVTDLGLIDDEVEQIAAQQVTFGQILDGKASQSDLNFQIARIDNAASQITTLNTTVANFPSQYTSASSFSTLQSEIVNARNGLGSLSARFTQVNQTITDGLAGKASTTQVNGISSEITAARGGLTNLSARFTSLTQTITDGLAGKASVQSVTDLNLTVSSKNRTFRQTTTPSGAVVGDIWYKTDDNNRPRRFNGSSWDMVDDSRIATAEGNITTITSRVSSAETAITDLNANKASATSFNTLQTEVTNARGGLANLSARFSALNTAITDGLAGKASVQSVTDLSVSVSAKNTVYRQNTDPPNPVIGDLLFKPVDGNIPYRYAGPSTGWVNVSDQRVSDLVNTTVSLNARITSAETAVTDLQNGKASVTQVQQAQATANDAAASVASLTTVVAGIDGTVDTKFGLVLDANNYISGYENTNNGIVSQFRIRADVFQIVPSGSGASTTFANGKWIVKNSAGINVVELGLNVG